MTSAELKAAKAIFVSNVDSFISQIESLSSTANTAEKDLTNSTDTILTNEISSKSKTIIQAINNTITKVNAAKSAALAAIDAEIERLIQEEIAQEKARIARLNAQKKLETENTNNKIQMEKA